RVIAYPNNIFKRRYKLAAYNLEPSLGTFVQHSFECVHEHVESLLGGYTSHEDYTRARTVRRSPGADDDLLHIDAVEYSNASLGILRKCLPDIGGDVFRTTD